LEEHFISFSVTISRLNKLIQKLKTEGMKLFDMKAAHTLCLYQLLFHNGSSFSELAVNCDLDPALVSRILSELTENGMVRKEGKPGKYNARYYLTKSGQEISSQIREIINSIQLKANINISPEDLTVFYHVLYQLLDNFEDMASKTEELFQNNEKEAIGAEK